MVHLPTLPLQQDLQTPISEPAPDLRQLAQPHPQWLVLAPAFPIATRRTIQSISPQARRWLSSTSTCITSTASRCACGLTTFLRPPPSTPECPPPARPRCASADGSPLPVAAAALPRSVPSHRTCSSTGRNTPAQSRVAGTVLPSPPPASDSFRMPMI